MMQVCRRLCMPVAKHSTDCADNQPSRQDGRGIMPLLFHAASAISAANLAVDNFFQLSGDKLPANVGNMVDKHLTFEVVVFVLQHACEIAFEHLLMTLEVFVLPFKVNFLDAAHIFVNSG